MKRRGFLKLLLALPFAPKLAEAAAKTICPERIMSLDKALSGSNQTSIWFVEWGDNHPPTWREGPSSIRYNHRPVIEVLSQKNSLLQDMVWQEKNIQLGHKVSWGSRWIGKSRRFM